MYPVISNLASVRFEQPTYSINENSASPLQPVLLLSQPFHNDVNVMIRAQDVTATGREASYIHLVTILMYIST